MYYHCEKKSAIGHYEHFQDYLKGGSLNLFLRQKTSEIKKKKDSRKFTWILKPFPGSRIFREKTEK